MKFLHSLLCFFILTLASAFGHGVGGHIFREEEEQSPDSHSTHTHSSGKSFKDHATTENDRWWGASLETGWTSREVHYGVDETGNYGAYTTELNVSLGRFNLGVWSGFGTGNDFQEWDFTAAYTFEVGSVFLIPGYNFRYMPNVADAHSEEEHGHDEDHAHESDEHTGHQHKTSGHEVFFVLGTTAIKYVTPSLNFVWDLSNTPGAYLDFRLDGDIPLYRDVFTLHPYALLSLNLGYNTREYYGWNNFQFGLEAVWRLNRNISLVGGINYSVAMTALREIDQDNIVWAKTSVRFEF